MRYRFLISCLAALLFVTAATVSPALANSGSHATAWFSPARVPIGGTATLKGTHLRPSTYYELLLAVPDTRKGAIERLFGLVKTNANGGLTSSVHLPVVTKCGSASVYLYPIKQNGSVRAKLTLTRCTVSKHVPPPPAPVPTPKGKGKGKTPPPPP